MPNTGSPLIGGSYETHYADLGKGGLRSVADQTAMLAIIGSRLEEGMQVYRLDNTTTYKLKNGYSTPTIITDWEEVSSGGVTSAQWDQNGFPTKSTSTLTWTDTTPDYTLSIQPTATSFTYFMAGVEYTSTGDTVQIDNTKEGIHAIYYDGSTLTALANPTEIDIEGLIRNKCLVCILYWDVSEAKAIYVGEERHGKDMSPASHSYHHFKDGLVYLSGLGLNTMSVDGSGATADAQFGIDSGGVTDEDLYLSIDAVTATTGLPIYYMLGADAEWQKETNAGFSVLTEDGTTSTRLAYNNNNAGTWERKEESNGDFVLYHIFATTEKDLPMISIMGQNGYATRNQAREGALVEVHELILNDVLFPEIRPVATVIYQTRLSYANNVNARVVSTDEGDDYIDWRDQAISRTEISTTSHSALTGLEWSVSGHNDINLNANYNSDGRVGLGTLTPSAQLDVQLTDPLDVALTGTVSVGVGSANVTGIGTAFTTEVVIGEVIKIAGEDLTVGIILSDTSIRLTTTHTAGASGVTAYKSNVDLLNLSNQNDLDRLGVDRGGNLVFKGVHDFSMYSNLYSTLEFLAIKNDNENILWNMDSFGSQAFGTDEAKEPSIPTDIISYTGGDSSNHLEKGLL